MLRRLTGAWTSTWRPSRCSKSRTGVLHLALRDQAVAHRFAVDEKIGQHRAFRKQAELLVDHADAEFAGGVGSVDGNGFAIQFDDAAVGPDHARQHLHQGRFAGAVLADHRMDGAAFDGQAHVVERNDAAITLGEIAHRDHWRNRHALPANGSIKRRGRTLSPPCESQMDGRIIRLRPRSAAALPTGSRRSASAIQGL